ncbi:hypothetical protein MN205_14985, partial [Kineococcus sp. TRM81007]
MLTRRGALGAAGCAAVAALLPGCTAGPAVRSGSSPGAGRGPAALTARPGPGGGDPAPPGERALGV